MKKVIFLIVIILFSKNVLGQTGLCQVGPVSVFTESPPCNTNPWVLVFEDDFNDNVINTGYWHDRQPWGDYAPPEAINLPENVILDGGNLFLIIKNENNWYHQTYYDQNSTLSFYPYSCASIWTKKAFKYGKFEIRCQIPSGNAFHPSFWLYGVDGETEIDVFEFYGKGELCSHPTDRPHMNVHYDFTPNSPQPNSYSDNVNCPENFTGPDFSAGMHTFTLIWDKYKIEWWVDGVLKKTQTKYYNIAGQQVDCDDIIPYQYYTPELVFPDRPMQVILSTALEKNCFPPDIINTFPNYMEVEYIKIWQQENDDCCIPFKLYESTDNLPAATYVEDYIKAGDDAGVPNVSGGVTVQTGQHVSFGAGNEVALLPGFTVEQGATFNATNFGCSPFNQPEGDDIVINNIPSSFSPDGDGIDDELCVSVNGATSYNIRVTQSGWPYNSLYYREDVPINSDPVCVWDGTCDYTGNCGTYVKCDKDRNIAIEFLNCDKVLYKSKEVYVSCANARVVPDSLNSDSITKNKLNEQNSFYFKISPNPCKSFIQMDYLINCSDQIIVDFFTITGQKQKELFIPCGKNNKIIDVSDLADGVYSYRVYNGTNLFKSDKIVVIK